MVWDVIPGLSQISLCMLTHARDYVTPVEIAQLHEDRESTRLLD